MTTLIPVPLWTLLLVMVLMVAWQIATAVQTRNLRQLFEWYLEARAKDHWSFEDDPAPSAGEP